MSKHDSAFTGSIPELYDRYMVPLFFEPFADDLASRVSALSPGSVLELGAGTGVLSRALGRTLQEETTIVATDLNQPMLDHAAARSDARIIFRQANAQELPFAAHSFDCVVCQFGVMFFSDKLAAYREVRRVLKPSGRFLFSVWDRLEENELSLAAAQSIKAFFEGEAPAFISRTPFGYFDVPQIERELHQAGFSGAAVSTVALTASADSPRNAALALIQGTPLRNEIEARDPALLDQLTVAVQSSLGTRFGSGAFHTKMQAHLFTVIP